MKTRQHQDTFSSLDKVALVDSRNLFALVRYLVRKSTYSRSFMFEHIHLFLFISFRANSLAALAYTDVDLLRVSG